MSKLTADQKAEVDRWEKEMGTLAEAEGETMSREQFLRDTEVSEEDYDRGMVLPVSR